MSGCLLILALIKRDESLQLVHRLELPRVRVGLEQLADAVRPRLGGLVVAPARGPPPLEVGDLRLLPARECRVACFIGLLHQERLELLKACSTAARFLV